MATYPLSQNFPMERRLLFFRLGTMWELRALGVVSMLSYSVLVDCIGGPSGYWNPIGLDVGRLLTWGSLSRSEWPLHPVSETL